MNPAYALFLPGAIGLAWLAVDFVRSVFFPPRNRWVRR